MNTASMTQPARVDTHRPTPAQLERQHDAETFAVRAAWNAHFAQLERAGVHRPPPLLWYVWSAL